MKIGIDIQSTRGQATGLGVYTRNLTQSLSEQANGNCNFLFFNKKMERDLNVPRRWLWENIELFGLARKNRVDLLHVPAFAPPYRKRFKVVVTAHDLIGMTFPNQMRWPSRFYWGKWLPFAIKRADAIIADSLHTKKDLMEQLNITPQKIHVIHPSGHELFKPLPKDTSLANLKKKFAIRKHYFLFVGTIEPRKNLGRAIQAFTSFLKKNNCRGDYQLIVVGNKGFAHGKWFRSLYNQNQINMGEIIFTGYTSHEDLNQLYAAAHGFVFPSLYEGFGIPILEAMASGCPVITSTTTSTPEVAGNAAIYVDPYDSQSIMEAMTELASSAQRREQLIEKGFERIKLFSWKDTAQKTINVYETVC